jgi:glycosyltransferase involved in cell wall biosynthesis
VAERRYNVFYITSTSDIGGAETMLLRFLQSADRRRFNFFVCSLSGSGLLTARCSALDVPAWNLNLTKVFHAHRLARLYSLLRRNAIDLVQTFGLRADTIGRPLARLARVPVVISSIRSPDPWRKSYHVLLDRLTAPLVDLFIANSEAGRQSRIERERFPAEKIITIHNGIEPLRSGLSVDRTAVLARFGIPVNASPLVGVIANIRSMKGHSEVIAATAELLGEYPRMKVLFAGRDSLGGRMQAAAMQRGVADSVVFLNYQENVGEVYSILDVFLLPSHWEGCPSSVLEAMAYGLPIVATDVGGIPEIIEHGKTGLLIPPRQPEAIVEALSYLFAHPDVRKELGAAGRKVLEEKFSLQRMTEAISRCYLDLLSRKKQ